MLRCALLVPPKEAGKKPRLVLVAVLFSIITAVVLLVLLLLVLLRWTMLWRLSASLLLTLWSGLLLRWHRRCSLLLLPLLLPLLLLCHIMADVCFCAALLAGSFVWRRGCLWWCLCPWGCRANSRATCGLVLRQLIVKHRVARGRWQGLIHSSKLLLVCVSESVGVKMCERV